MKKSILVVDANASDREAARQILISQNYRVLTGQTLQGARAAMKDVPLDLIVTETTLPDGCGFAFCREIRDENGILFMFYTQDDEKGTILKGYEAGADFYLSKSYGLDMLSACIGSLLRRAERDNQRKIRELSFGPLSVDIVNRTVRVHNEDTGLADKEFCLLMALLQNRDRICSPEELYAEVWGRPHAGEANTVRVHVTNLRKKLQLKKYTDLEIASVYRKGYQIKLRS